MNYLLNAETLQCIINILQELPYKNVYNVLNAVQLVKEHKCTTAEAPQDPKQEK